MRLLRLRVLVISALLGTAAIGCSTTIEGTGTFAAGVVTGGPGPTATGSPTVSTSPTGSALPTRTATPKPTTNPVTVERRVLCVLEQAAITSLNSRFNKAKTRSAQVAVLRSGATTISGHLGRSGLPRSDRIHAAGAAVLSQLNTLIRVADGGGDPSTGPYNTAAKNFQKACAAT